MEILAFIQAEAERLIEQVERPEPPVLFLAGPQGSGKTTLTNQLLEQIQDSVCLSLDDFYLSKAERQTLAQNVHPLFETRGPPGTHHIDMLANTISELTQLNSGRPVIAPVFDKRTDEVAPHAEWRQIATPPRLILVEGWMLGVSADPEAPSSEPINAVEAQDAEGIWRAYQEAMLATTYADIWGLADQFVYLDTDDFANIHQWRAQQEAQTLGLESGTLPEDRRAWLKHFIAHYERLTRRLLAGERRPGLAIEINLNREIVPHD